MNEDYEEWRDIAGYPYEISSLGRVRRTRAAKGAKVGRILKHRTSKNRYPFVTLHLSAGLNETRYVHDLVCETFNGSKRSRAHEVAHWDGSRTNCKPDNLRWVTRKENMEDAARHGTTPKGSTHYRVSLDEDKVRQIRLLASIGLTRDALSLQFNTTRRVISKITTQRTWAHVQ